MKSASILTHLAVFLVSLASARQDNYFGRAACYSAFALAGFDIFDFDSYPNYFNDDSVMQLAQTGAYKGAAGIEEYVRFGSPTSPFIAALKSYDKDAQVKTANDSETGECVVTVAVTSAAKFSDLVDIDRATARIAFLKLYFEPTSVNTISITNIYVFYEQEYLEYFFGNLTNTDQTREYGVAKMEALPAIGDKADVSGDTQGCRVLHSAFAETNPSHCPHISFVPEEDENGNLKCQQSRFRPVSEMFDDDDLLVFDQKKEELELDNDIAGVICDCSVEDNSSSLWSGFTGFLNGMLSIGPLPETWRFGTIPFCEICSEE